MKLRTRLTLLSVLLTAAAVAACCALSLAFVRQKEMAGVAEAGLADYAAMQTAFRRAVPATLPENPLARRSLLLSELRALEGFAEYALRLGDDFLTNNAGFDPERLLEGDAVTVPGDAGIRFRAVRVGPDDYWIASASFPLGTDVAQLTLVRNISEVTNALGALAVRCAAAGLAVAAAAAAAVWLFVFRAMRPVATLRSGAAELAAGRYEKRIALSGKDELAELAADFNRMADAVEANVAALRETAERRQAFINDLSHELKTPVTSILLNAETLLGRKVPEETLHRSLTRIYDQGKWLEQLSQKLMTLVLVQGETVLRPESVDALLDAVRASTADALASAGMALRTDCRMDTLEMDFDLLRAALVNLVENARRASSAGQAVELRAGSGVIEVADRGTGIPPEELARVTEPFYTADRSRSKRHGGSGLGLALVQRIAEAHGARLSIESTPGVGTVVRLAFPPPE